MLNVFIMSDVIHHVPGNGSDTIFKWTYKGAATKRFFSNVSYIAGEVNLLKVFAGFKCERVNGMKIIG